MRAKCAASWGATKMHVPSPSPTDDQEREIERLKALVGTLQAQRDMDRQRVRSLAAAAAENHTLRRKIGELRQHIGPRRTVYVASLVERWH